MRKKHPLAAALVLFGLSVSASAGIEEDVQQLLAAGNYQAALQQAEVGLQQNAGNRKLLLARGFALVKLNRLDEAANYYQQLRQVMPDDPEPGNNLAMIYRMQKKYPQSITVFAETIQAFPDYAAAYGNLGDTYIELAQYQYQQGFAATGSTTLQTKAALSENFGQLVAQSMQATAAPSVSPAPAASAPAPVQRPTTGPVDSAQVQQSVVEKLSEWADAWMSLDSNRYFSHYSQQFVPPAGRSLDEWMQRKQNALNKAEYIKIYLTDISIQYQPENPGFAAAQFNQAYASDTFQGRTGKRLEFKNSPNGWLIISEANIK